ncbi:MAG TPA: hypothetical protein VKR99_07520 [Candidatus Eremiobacteraceae bacterium]|nr:hypothetical protein [Candidatus Eremiobacteraceae bacterium]
MARNNFVAATFPLLRYATGAVDWFRNQAIAPDAIVIAAQPPQGGLRLPQRGDNMRSDLKWVVALDLDAAAIGRQQALETLQREGGVILKHIPDDLPVASRR